MLFRSGLEKTIENIFMPIAENGNEPDFYFPRNEIDSFGLKVLNIGKKNDRLR